MQSIYLLAEINNSLCIIITRHDCWCASNIPYPYKNILNNFLYSYFEKKYHGIKSCKCVLGKKHILYKQHFPDNDFRLL